MSEPAKSQSVSSAQAAATKQPKTVTPIEEFRKTIDAMTDQFTKALPKSIPADRFKRVLGTAIQLNPDLLACDRNSLLAAAMKCAAAGLLPDGREASLRPYKNQVSFSPMIAGLCKLARNSGEIGAIDAIVVYENDEYTAWTDETGAHFKHARTRKEPGAVLLTFAYAITKDKFLYFEEIDEAQMADIEACSPSKDGPWKGPFKDEMRRKSAMRRLCKYRLPASSDLSNALELDDDKAFEEATPVKIAQQPTSSRLAKIVGAATESKPAEKPVATEQPESDVPL